MRALVTGASGFIGRRVVAALNGAGWTVGEVAHAPAEAALGLGAGEPADFRRLLEVFAPDIVFHLAGRMIGSAGELYAANAVLASNLLQAVEGSSTRPAVVLAGSAAEYGLVADADLPVGEDHPCRPISDYGVSKHAQTLAGLARARAGMLVMVARIFNPLGRGMPQSLALPNFAAQICTDDILRVGDLDVERDFIDVEEAVRVIVALTANASNFGQVFNICAGKGFRLRDLVQEMIRLSGRDVRLQVEPGRLRTNHVRRFIGSTTRLAGAGITVAQPDTDRLLRALLADAASAPDLRPAR